jgi:hypothetical protein
MIEHSAISKWLPRDLWLLAHGEDPDRLRFEELARRRGDSSWKHVKYYDYARKVRDLRQQNVGLNAAIEMAAKHYRVTSRTVRNARRFLRELGLEK